MESSRTGWMSLALLALTLAAVSGDEHLFQPVTYPVGNLTSMPNWFPNEIDTSFYQNWIDQLTVYVNDSLMFLVSDSSHDVTLVGSEGELSDCWMADGRTLARGPVNYTVPFPDVGAVYFFLSSGPNSVNSSADCRKGMQFSFTVSSRLAPDGNSGGSDSNSLPPIAIAHPATPATAPAPAPGPVLVPAPSFPAENAPAPGNGNSSMKTDQGVTGKTIPVAAVALATTVISVLALSVLGVKLCREQYGSKPRARYEERHVVHARSFDNAGEAPVVAINGILEGGDARRSTGITFTYDELNRATSSFSEKNEVGKGGSGTVFKGTLDDGKTVAIKKLKLPCGGEQFVHAVGVLSQVKHRNLVRLLGCCIEVSSPCLVYEFVSNGTLQYHLSLARFGFGTGLDWNARFRIALQTAEALKYLHVQATPSIVHRDVKSANILLDHNFNGKVADFGIFKLVDLEATHVSTTAKGTLGYLDPDYIYNWQLTDKTDVYSYGVVLLELITSKKPVDYSQSDEVEYLALTSIPLIKSGRVREIIDSRMLFTLSPEDLHAVEAVAQVAVACLGSSRASRPSMSEVVEMLRRIRGSKLKADELYSKSDGGNAAEAQGIQAEG